MNNILIKITDIRDKEILEKAVKIINADLDIEKIDKDEYISPEFMITVIDYLNNEYDFLDHIYKEYKHDIEFGEDISEEDLFLRED